MLQNSKTEIFAKLKSSKCDKTKIKIVTTLKKTPIVTKLKKKLKLSQKLKTQIGTKLKNSNCHSSNSVGSDSSSSDSSYSDIFQ